MKELNKINIYFILNRDAYTKIKYLKKAIIQTLSKKKDFFCFISSNVYFLDIEKNIATLIFYNFIIILFVDLSTSTVYSLQA
jgi:hypothetical protein